jgi:ubiquinone/menaquinone biosynthesis C-methylase UbiE
MPGEKLDSPSDPLFKTQKRTILEIWDQMQRLQTDFAFSQELTAYFTSPQWCFAKTVLDLGTGNGYYLSKIAARFPDKIYHGVDTSSELIAIAKREVCSKNVTFSSHNLFDVIGRYDFVLVRLLLQHLDDIQAVLNHMSTLTNPRGAVLIIDSHDPLRFFYPDFPEFREFFSTYAEHELRAGRDRRVANRIEQAIATSTVWQPGGNLQLLIPSTIPDNLDLFTKTYSFLVDLVEQVGEIKYDFFSVKEAWRRWLDLPDAYTQVGLNLIRLDRV